VVEVIMQLATPGAAPGAIALLLQNGRTLDPFAAKKGAAQAAGSSAASSSSSISSISSEARPAAAAQRQQEQQRAAAAAWASPGSKTSYQKARRSAPRRRCVFGPALRGAGAAAGVQAGARAGGGATPDHAAALEARPPAD
jgi:hypothetical protein